VDLSVAAQLLEPLGLSLADIDEARLEALARGEQRATELEAELRESMEAWKQEVAEKESILQEFAETSGASWLGWKVIVPGRLTCRCCTLAKPRLPAPGTGRACQLSWGVWCVAALEISRRDGELEEARAQHAAAKQETAELQAVVSGAEARAAETAARREAEAQAAEEAAEARVAETLAQWKSKLGVLEAELEAAERAKAAIR
jgi:hypothetical protein